MDTKLQGVRTGPAPFQPFASIRVDSRFFPRRLRSANHGGVYESLEVPRLRVANKTSKAAFLLPLPAPTQAASTPRSTLVKLFSDPKVKPTADDPGSALISGDLPKK